MMILTVHTLQGHSLKQLRSLLVLSHQHLWVLKERCGRRCESDVTRLILRSEQHIQDLQDQIINIERPSVAGVTL